MLNNEKLDPNILRADEIQNRSLRDLFNLRWFHPGEAGFKQRNDDGRLWSLLSSLWLLCPQPVSREAEGSIDGENPGTPHPFSEIRSSHCPEDSLIPPFPGRIHSS